MHVILFDDQKRINLLPFTHTRPAADIRCGILTMRERWEKRLSVSSSGTLTESFLQEVYPGPVAADTWLLNGRMFATSPVVNAVLALQPGQKLLGANGVIAARISAVNVSYAALSPVLDGLETISYYDEVREIANIWDIFSLNDWAIREDYALITSGRTTQSIPEWVTVAGAEHVFLEEGATIAPGTVINARTGPVYLGKDSEIMEGCMIRGPLALGEHAALKMGAKVYGATTIGDGSKVGGEISNVVFFSNSNKGHDGFLGNAVIGSWCNLGADTNCSNLKNNYDEVKVWHEHSGRLVRTGLQFCGLIMGDHSKCGINTMFNTGTVVGVSANIFGAGFPDKFVPSFTWGGADDLVTYQFDKAMDTANRMMQRRGKSLSEAEIRMYQVLFDHTASQREGR